MPPVVVRESAGLNHRVLSDSTIRACYTRAFTALIKERSMGEIVAAFGVCHSPHLLTRPPDEVPEQSEASIGAMRQLGRVLDEVKPDVIVFLGSDHLDTFSMTCVPTFAIICGERVIADHAGHHYDLPNNRDIAEDFLENLIRAGFDMA